MAAAVGIAVLVVAGLWFSFTVLFKIERFSVQGESPYTQEEIVEMVGLAPGDNMFGFSVTSAERRLEENLPYLEEVTIRRRLPGTVVFRVTQAEETYCFPWEGGWAVLSAGCKVLRLDAEHPSSLISLYGVAGVSVEPGLPLAAGEPGTGFAFSPEVYWIPPAEEAPQEETPLPEGEAPAEAAEAATEEVPPEGEAPAEGEAEEETPEEALSEEVASAEDETPPEEEGGAEEEEPLVIDLSLLKEVLAQIDESGMDNITWVDISDPLEIRFCWEDRITVRLGARNNLQEKLDFVYVLLMDPEKSQVTEGDRGTLDVSAYPDTTDRAFLLSA